MCLLLSQVFVIDKIWTMCSCLETGNKHWLQLSLCKALWSALEMTKHEESVACIWRSQKSWEDKKEEAIWQNHQVHTFLLLVSSLLYWLTLQSTANFMYLQPGWETAEPMNYKRQTWTELWHSTSSHLTLGDGLMVA